MTWSQKFQQRGDAAALLIGGTDAPVRYRDLAREVDYWMEACRRAGIGPGAIVSFPAAYDLRSLSLFFALAECGATLVPLPVGAGDEQVRLQGIAYVTHELSSDRLEPVATTRSPQPHRIYRELQDAGHPGLVLFTSGTSGQPKAAVHDLEALCLRYTTPRPTARILAFMQIDHIGGVNTMLFIMSHGGTLVAPASRSPNDVCAAIEQHRVEVLPTSPTFLNMMLISGCLERFDLTSLQRITYGSEPMPTSVLARVTGAIPNVQMLQTYGTTELGILKSKSRDNGSLWMKVGGEGYDVKIVDGRLWVRAATAMLGYLNAPSPFDAEGYMDTGDQVEIEGDWLRILGRKCEVINVGGIKVSPTEVESVLLEMPGVQEVSVRGEAHPLTGQIVAAVVRLESEEETPRAFKMRMRQYCRDVLPPSAIPAKVSFTTENLVTDRFKRSR